MKLFQEIVIETIASCNRTCISCLRQSYPARDGSLPLLRTVEHKIGQGYKMPKETFCSIIDQLRELKFRGQVVPQFFNEPLLDDRLPDLVAYARKMLPESKLVFCTNADLMTLDLAKKFDGIADQLNIALYMPDERRFARRAQLRRMFKRTRLEFRAPGHNLTHFSPFPEREEMVKSVIDDPCTRFHHLFIVNSTGDVSFCCEDVNADFKIGNVNDTPIKELWFGERNKEIMQALDKAKGRHKFEHCRSCPRPEEENPARVPVFQRLPTTFS